MVTLSMKTSVRHLKKTIVKWQDKTRITKTFKSEFQLAIMEANATTYLYNVTPNIERHNEIEMETNIVEATLTTMKKCLQQENAIATLIVTTSYTYVGS